MQIYAIKLFNFFRFGEENNSIVFDILNKDKEAYENGSLSLDQIYEQLALDPINYIKQVKVQGITPAFSIEGRKAGNYDKSNGVGKSSILEGMCFAPYDQIVRKNINTDRVEKAGVKVVTKFNGEYPKGLKESYVEEFFEEGGKINE